MTKKGFALIGELLLISATLIVLYMVYQFWFSNAVSEVRSGSLSQAWERAAEAEELAPTSEVVAQAVAEVKPEPTAIGQLYIPRLKSDVWGEPIVVGVNRRELAYGVGYYPKTALPGEIGNFAIAGHRATDGEPFARFERLQQGDQVIVRTAEGYFTYELFKDKKIKDSETWVLNSVPKGIVTEPEALITLTTCDPRWNSTRRWAWWGRLVESSSSSPEVLK